MCRLVSLVVLLLLIGTRSRLLVVGLLSIAEPLCPSRCLFGTILVTLCLMVWDWRVSRPEPMLSCWHDLLFLWCFLLFYLLLPSMSSLCGVEVFGLIECSPSLPALHSGLQIIIIITIIIYWEWHLIPRWLLRSIFVLFPEQLLKNFPTNHIWSYNIKCTRGPHVNHMGTPRW